MSYFEVCAEGYLLNSKFDLVAESLIMNELTWYGNTMIESPPGRFMTQSLE